jgi:phosphatidate cytidylyltransferase
MSSELINRIFSSIILVSLTLFFIIKGAFLFNLFIFIFFLITAYEWHMMSKKKIYNVPGYIFLLLSFWSVFALRNNFSDESLFLFLFILLTCVFTDIGGYVFGKFFKGPKLTKISPKKTYSGVVGGYLFSIISIIIFVKNSDLLHLGITSRSFDLKLLILLFTISTVSQIGDIIISYFKRVSKIKDTGKLIPGHGGLLDRIDGMIFAFPFYYGILLILN